MRTIIGLLFACMLAAFAATAGAERSDASPAFAAGLVMQGAAEPEALVTQVRSCRECAQMQCRGLRIACPPGCRCSDLRPGGGRDSCRSCAEKQCRGLRIACPRGCSCRDQFPGRR